LHDKLQGITSGSNYQTAVYKCYITGPPVSRVSEFNIQSGKQHSTFVLTFISNNTLYNISHHISL